MQRITRAEDRDDLIAFLAANTGPRADDKGGEKAMKAFLAAIAALVIITVGADYLLDHIGFSAAEVYQTDSVRLGD